MKNIIKTATVFLFAISLLSCNGSSGYTKDIKVMKSEDFYFEFVLMGEVESDTDQKGIFARSDDTYYLRLDDSALLHPKRERYAIDHAQKTYWVDETIDLNYEWFDALFDSLKAVETITNDDEIVAVECKNKSGRKIVLTYKDDSLSQIDLYLYSADFSTKCSILVFSTTIPDNISFSVPEGYSRGESNSYRF